MTNLHPFVVAVEAPDQEQWPCAVPWVPSIDRVGIHIVLAVRTSCNLRPAHDFTAELGSIGSLQQQAGPWKPASLWGLSPGAHYRVLSISLNSYDP